MKETKQLFCCGCGKELKSGGLFRGITYFEAFDRVYCSECYVTVTTLCASKEEADSRDFSELRYLFHKENCDLCGRKTSRFMTDRIYVRDGMICKDCVRLLRSFYSIDKADIAATAAVNAAGLLIGLATDGALVPGAGVDDPLKKARIEDLRERYEEVRH